MKLGLGLALALAAALVLNVGFFVQHGATNSMLSLSLRHPFRSVRLLVTDRQWMLGYATGWVGWGIYIAALSLAPLSLVQAVAAGGVGVLAFLAHRLGTPLERRERLGAWIAVAGLLLLGLSLTAHVPDSPGGAHLDPAHRDRRRRRGGGAVGRPHGPDRTRAGVALGCAAGLFFGVGDLATKGAVSGNGLLFIPLLAGCTALGFVTLQLAFQRGRVLETAGLSVLVNNMIPIVGGLLLFHEALPGGAAGVARVASFVAVVVGAVLLARAPEAPIEEDGEPRPARSTARTRHKPVGPAMTGGATVLRHVWAEPAESGRSGEDRSHHPRSTSPCWARSKSGERPSPSARSAAREFVVYLAFHRQGVRSRCLGGRPLDRPVHCAVHASLDVLGGPAIPGPIGERGGPSAPPRAPPAPGGHRRDRCRTIRPGRRNP